MDIRRFKRVEELFDAALEMPAGRRYAYLERACGSDVELLDTVVRLLHHAGPPQSPAADSDPTKLHLR